MVYRGIGVFIMYVLVHYPSGRLTAVRFGYPAESWGIALFEYLLQVPANRIGYTTLSLAVETAARNYYAVCVCAVCGVLHAAAVEAGLFMGRTLFTGRGIFYVSQRVNRD